MEAAGLNGCACKRGFFTLRDCPNAATVACDICSRRFCADHLALRVDAKVCVECAAKQAEEGAVRPSAGRRPTRDLREEDDPADPGLPYRYRARYYDYYDYEPMWWGSYDPYWSDYGYRWYDDSYDDSYDDDGGFGDS